MGARDNTLGVISQNLEGQDMANVLSKTDKMTATLTGIRRKVRAIEAVIDRLEPGKTEEQTDVSRTPRGSLHWCAPHGLVEGVIQ